MPGKKASTSKLIRLLVFFIGAMCFMCTGFAFYIVTGTPLSANTTSIPLATTTKQPPAQTAELIPSANRIASPPGTPDPSPNPEEEVSSPPNLTDNLKPLLVHFVNVGQGDSTLIQTPDGYTALIDGGEKDTGIVQYLQSAGVKRIDLMIATHPHSDHIGGLVQVLQAFPVAKVVTNGQAHTTSTYESFLDGIAAAHAEYVEVKQGDRIKLGDPAKLGSLVFSVLNPVANTNANMNENSIVLRFSYGNISFLMMGDSGRDTEASLIAAGQVIKTDILKVGHHGSASASSPEFLKLVRPAVAVYMAGINNQFNHPAPETVTALKAGGATVYGTDKDGTIVFTVEQNRYTTQALGAQSVGASAVVPPVEEPAVLPTSTQAVAIAGGLEITSVTSPVNAGSYATLTAKTTPGASCGITVYYKSGPSTAQGLGPQTAGAGGDVSWTWKVGSRTTSGNWRIVVTCGAITQETTFTVQ